MITSVQSTKHNKGDTILHARYYSQTEVLDNVPTCYLLLGGIMSGIQLLCLLSMSNPPDPEREGQEGQEVQVKEQSVSLPATDQLGRNVSAVGNGR